MVDLRVHDAGDADSYRDDVMTVWHNVFGPIEDPGDWRESIWERHRARADYRLATAHDHGRLVGFSWGYTGQPGQFWSDLIRDKLPAIAAEWVGGHFEFVELAVIAEERGRGTGGRLHDVLMADLTHHRALLGTSDDPTSPAVHLYKSRGWVHLGKQNTDNQVMGKILRPEPDRVPTTIADPRSASESS